uniref:GTD-binding domain-containing protein n=1 Tax=Aegilops tauschii TaxID=37682 RepID=M8CRG7_AEGTA
MGCCLCSVAWFSYWFDNLGLITEGNTYCRCAASSLPLWGNTDNEPGIKHTPSKLLEMPAIPDVEIIEEKSSSSTLLSSMGISSSSRKSSSSCEHISELEHIIATQEADAEKASEMFHEELNEILFTQIVEIKELKKKQLEEIEHFKMDLQKKSIVFEKRQIHTEAMLSHLLRKSTQSTQDSV